MNRVDNSRFLHYLEPLKEEKSNFPIEDGLSQIMIVALSEANTGTANYSEINEPPRFIHGKGFKGHHTTDCGKASNGSDYLMENRMITNSLAALFLQFYRGPIPDKEMKKVN